MRSEHLLLEESPELAPAPQPALLSRGERRRVESLKRRLLFAITVPPLALALIVALITRPDSKALRVPSPAEIGAGGKPVTYLVMTVRSDDLSRQADTLTLFTLGGGAKPYALMIPPSALTEIPGYGFDAVSKSLSFGRVPLADVTVENLVGVRVDHTMVIDNAAMARLVDRIGGVRIVVPSDLFQDDGAGRLVPVFSAGEQRFNGKRAVAYLTFQAPDETELSRLARAQQLWEAILARYPGDRSGTLAKLVAGLGGGLQGDESASRFAVFMASFGSVNPAERTFDVVPVTPVGSADEQGAFKVEPDELQALVGRYVPGSAAGDRVRLQLLNGNGTPEAGVAVAQKLIPQGFWLVDSGNARSFEFAETKIIVYVNDEETMAAAEKVRRLLGVGQIELSRSLHTSIDVTVVIGKDFRAA
jgi:LCP family protein required for cell wall assembly